MRSTVLVIAFITMLASSATAAPRAPGYIRDVATDGSRLFAAADRGLAIYDVKDPARPRLRVFVRLAGNPHGVHVVGKFAVIETSDDIVVFDVQRATPKLVTRYPVDPDREITPWVTSEGNVVVIAGWWGTRVFEASRTGLDLVATLPGPNVGTPLLASGVLILNEAHYESVAGKLMPTEPDHTTVVDLRDPRSPVTIGRLPANNWFVTNGRTLWSAMGAYAVTPGQLPRFLGVGAPGRGFLHCVTPRVTVLGSKVVELDGRAAQGTVAVTDTSGKGCAEIGGWLYTGNGLAGIGAYRIANLVAE